ncbi:MAG: hypothetical protein IKN47_04225 [Lachnospiraceae bacterium]|jgi:hypothetical protein|nr:hypothetical protein [Lachnospiraceae bacterium]
MEENTNETKPQWKGCVIFGLINIALVLLCTKLNIIMVSAVMILLIVIGVAVTIQSLKEDWREGFKASAVGCVIGLLLNCFAGVLYIFNILSGLIGMLAGFAK